MRRVASFASYHQRVAPGNTSYRVALQPLFKDAKNLNMKSRGKVRVWWEQCGQKAGEKRPLAWGQSERLGPRGTSMDRGAVGVLMSGPGPGSQVWS